MRIISGSLKGRKLIPPKGLYIRPTPDKVKGAIFNIIGERIVECSFLDLFAGTGAIGIEALSRGTKEVIFVENNIRAIDIIKGNLLKLQISRPTIVGAPKFQIMRCDAIKAINSFEPGQFDFIFLDPPYKSDFGEQALMEISRHNILKKDGEVIWEHYYRTEVRKQKPALSEVEGTEDRIKLKRTVRYGDTALSFFVHEIIKIKENGERGEVEKL